MGYKNKIKGLKTLADLPEDSGDPDEVLRCVRDQVLIEIYKINKLPFKVEKGLTAILDKGHITMRIG